MSLERDELELPISEPAKPTLQTYLKERALERSTWLSIITVAGLLGYNFEPEQIELIVNIGVFGAALVFGATPDGNPS